MALQAFSAIIIAAGRNILPHRDTLTMAFFNTIQSANSLQDQQIKGKALMCAGNLINSCGDSANFPQEALERFTSFALECLKQADAKYELKETAINYFSEISKILRSKMAPIIPMILDTILESTETKIAGKEVEKGKKEDEFDLDSDEEDDEDGIMLQLDIEAIDEQVSAIHCLGNLCLNCSELMQPHLERICK